MRTWDFVCQDCETPFTAKSPRALRCKDCRYKNHIGRNRRPGTMEDRTCENCGKTYAPWRQDQRACSGPCSSKLSNDSRSYGTTPDPDPQMERLYRYYKSKESISIDTLPNNSTVAIWSDSQYPFIDEPFFAALENFLSSTRPTIEVLDGDVLDAYEISDFDKRPERLWNLEDEAKWARDVLERHGRWSDIYWVDGNHEDRYRRILWRQAQAFSFAVSDLAEILRLEKLTKGFVPYGRHIDLLGFTITHGTIVRKDSAYTAKAMRLKYQSSGCNGHTHRAGSNSGTDSHGRSHTWYEIGCTCRFDLEYNKAPPDWQHAFLVGTVWDNALHTQLIRVIESGGHRSFTVNGERFKVD